MGSRSVFILLMAVWFAETARAEIHAPAESACLSADAQTESTDGSGPAYRIVFKNRCGAARSFSWCAENAQARVPAEIGCANGGAPSGEQRYVIHHRKEFLWRLPQGTRIRFQDCPEQEVPTSLGCAQPPSAPARR